MISGCRTSWCLFVGFFQQEICYCRCLLLLECKGVTLRRSTLIILFNGCFGRLVDLFYWSFVLKTSRSYMQYVCTPRGAVAATTSTFNSCIAACGKGNHLSLCLVRVFHHAAPMSGTAISKLDICSTEVVQHGDIAPENLPSQKETSIPTIIFQGRNVKLRRCIDFPLLGSCRKASSGHWR